MNPTPTSRDNTDELKKAIRKTYDVKTSHYVNFEPRLEKLMAVIEPFIVQARAEAAREAELRGRIDELEQILDAGTGKTWDIQMARAVGKIAERYKSLQSELKQLEEES